MTTQNIYSLVDVWNSAGTTFTGIGLSVTDTASASGSLLLDLQVGGASKFSVAKTGTATVNYPVSGTGVRVNGNGNGFVASVSGSDTTGYGPYGVRLQFDNTIEWSATSNGLAGADLRLARDAADTLAQRNGTNAQAFRVYRSFTDASNYSRLSTGWNISTALIRAEGAGTGTNGNIAFGSAALATSATVGYVMIPSCAGAPTGVPADIPTGQVALHYDSTNNKLYVYNGAWRSTAALT